MFTFVLLFKVNINDQSSVYLERYDEEVFQVDESERGTYHIIKIEGVNDWDNICSIEIKPSTKLVHAKVTVVNNPIGSKNKNKIKNKIK